MLTMKTQKMHWIKRGVLWLKNVFARSTSLISKKHFWVRITCVGCDQRMEAKFSFVPKSQNLTSIRCPVCSAINTACFDDRGTIIKKSSFSTEN
jgi:hypothetical protein